MKCGFVLGVVLFSGVAFAGEGLHNFSSSENPHAKGGCASKKDKVARFHQFHGKEWNQQKADKKLNDESHERRVKLADFI